MTLNRHQPDDPIDRTLAALRDAAPPPGMEARVLQTLDAQRLASRGPAARSRLRTLLIPQSAWFRGAFTGAAAASLLFGGFLFATRLAHVPHPSQFHRDGWDGQPAQTEASAPHSPQPTPVSMTTDGASPCTAGRVPHPGSAGVGSAAANARAPHSSRSYRDEWEEGSTRASSSRTPHLIPASFAPSKPAPPAPLTAQERALVQFARTATPAELAALHSASASDKQSDAEREAAFQKFFAPSPEVLAIDKAQGLAIDPNQATPPQPAEVHN